MAKIDPLKHLDPPERRLHRDLSACADLGDTYSQKILLTALEAHQRARLAREAIDKAGMTFIDKAGQIKAHPLLCVERDSRSAFLTGMRLLNIDVEKPKSVGRPAGGGRTHGNER
jgi:hypothetical protein